MRYVTFKDGVKIKIWTPALSRILSCLHIVQNSSMRLPTLVITSVADGQHMEGSRHYSGEAVDVRAKNFTWDIDKVNFMELMRKWLGPQFTVLHESVGTENEHFHIQVAKGMTFGGL